MTLPRAEGFSIFNFRIDRGNRKASEGLGEEETYKNVMQLG